MGRKKEDNERFITEQIQKVIDRITGKHDLENMKTWDDLRDIAGLKATLRRESLLDNGSRPSTESKKPVYPIET